ncbi:intercellular adhesion molecule 5-like [Onychostruthus taczanowskii]|uniref:intercellular adhesion molecule 5-like n=1 Tax=Onychostruthus taczanowskii TaxID=356909 RepID=UPI001B80E631|nr:intercellular adhesion molecule 5-like [Onychostruthus taczanowskii]
MQLPDWGGLGRTGAVRSTRFPAWISGVRSGFDPSSVFGVDLVDLAAGWSRGRSGRTRSRREGTGRRQRRVPPINAAVTFRTGGVGDTRGHPRTSAVGGGSGVSVQVTGAPPAGTGGTARGGGLAGVARGTFTVVAWPRVAVVAFGGSVTVNCSRSACPGDNATLGLETPLAATPGPGGLRWQSFRLQNVSRWNPGPVTCSGRCGDTEANASAGVLVYQLPERVELEPVPPVAVGDSRNVTCRVLEVAPLRNLTVTLRRGAETLRTESFGDAEGSASVAVSHLLTATRGDHGQDVTCHAELSLRPHGPLFARAAVPVTLSVFALPEPPQLQAPAILEAGTAAAASCRIAGAFPAGDIRVTAALGRQPLNVSVAVAGDTVTASTELSPRSPGPRELSCTAAVATAARTARRQLHVYRKAPGGFGGHRGTPASPRIHPRHLPAGFPAPALELSPAPAAAGSEVTVTCRAGATEPPAARLQLRDADGGVLAEGPQPRLQLRLLARRDDDGREFRCRASLAVGDSVVTKDAEARLEVLYLPEIPASGCPGNRTWVRGAREALSCRATGNPAPTVVCGRDGVAVATGEPEPVTRARAGTYLCNATNALGTRSRRVTVRVEYEPTLSEAGCPARRVWVEGQRRQLECRADGDPPPSTRCARDGGTHPGGVTRGRVVTRADGGRYVCRATNRHGVAVRSVLVTVEYQPSLGERGCPERRRWLEGTPAELGCAATGNPPPRVTCAKLGDPANATEPGDGQEPPRATANVTRAHAGTYRCRASNAHGSAVRNVTVAVECECGARFWGAPRGLRGALSSGRVPPPRHLPPRRELSTACKKGEYNVRDAEGSSEAACLHRHREARGEAFGIQLSPP